MHSFCPRDEKSVGSDICSANDAGQILAMKEIWKMEKF